MDVQGGRISAGSPGGDGGGDEHTGSCPGVRPAPGHGAQNTGLLRAAGLPATDPAQEAQAGALHRRQRPDPGGRSRASQEAATHCQAHLRAPQGRIRQGRRIHHGQGLRQRASPSDKGDVRAPVPCAGTRAVRLRRGSGSHRWRGAEGPLFRHRPAPQRRLLREGLPGGDHRGLPGRASISVCLSGRGAPEHPLRQYQAGGGKDIGRRPPPAHESIHRAAVPLPVRGPVRPPRQGQ